MYLYYSKLNPENFYLYGKFIFEEVFDSGALQLLCHCNLHNALYENGLISIEPCTFSKHGGG